MTRIHGIINEFVYMRDGGGGVNIELIDYLLFNDIVFVNGHGLSRCVYSCCPCSMPPPPPPPPPQLECIRGITGVLIFWGKRNFGGVCPSWGDFQKWVLLIKAKDYKFDRGWFSL